MDLEITKLSGIAGLFYSVEIAAHIATNWDTNNPGGHNVGLEKLEWYAAGAIADVDIPSSPAWLQGIRSGVPNILPVQWHWGLYKPYLSGPRSQ